VPAILVYLTSTGLALEAWSKSCQPAGQPKPARLIDSSWKGRYPAGMYVIKKIIGILTQPGIMVLVLLSFGLLRLLFSRGHKKQGWVWISLGIGCFYLFTTAPLPNYLLGRLESGLTPVTSPQNLSGIKYIVVLSGGLRPNFGLPATSQLEESSFLRVAEGVRLFHLLEGAPTLIMTGAGPFDDMGSRMVALAQSLGVPSDKLIPENQAIDTYGNAMGVRPLVKNQPFLLVTSASHLPRALAIFQKLGMKPVPAPGDFRFTDYSSIGNYIPSGSNLVNMELAIHEYLGQAYLALFPSLAGE
jgi:uncharacterized SAM-binding protein YcdF (DUF218 family)